MYAIRSYYGQQVEGLVFFEALAQLGQPVIQLSIMAATSLHEPGDELDAAGALQLGLLRQLPQLQLLLL